jgi:hypothetical protein
MTSFEEGIFTYSSCGERFKGGKIKALAYPAGSYTPVYLIDTVREGDPLVCDIPECRP